MAVKTIRVSVLWDASDQESLSHVVIRADQKVVETEEPRRSQYLLDGKVVLDVPEANYRGDREID